MKKTAVLLGFLLLIATPYFDRYAIALDCAGGIISTGDSRFDLLKKCGEPDFKDSHAEEFFEQFGRGIGRKVIITVEEWTYNFGPSQFMRIVVLKNGTVADIREGNYGYRKDAKSDQHECGGPIVVIGDLKSDVLMKCGEPALKDAHQEEFGERVGNGLGQTVYVTVEEWTYNYGPNRFVRIFTFTNGKVSDIKTGGYGF
jgi:hypothetical protein